LLTDLLGEWHVHYYFIAEAPEKSDGEPVFGFLPDMFPVNEMSRVSFINHMDVQTALFHMMNADMLVTTGSSFPYIAATISPKVRFMIFVNWTTFQYNGFTCFFIIYSSQPVVLFGKPKEKKFLNGMLRDDFILLEDDGCLAAQLTRGEIQALIATRYSEVAGRMFPYGYGA